jgi:uncharacterized protein (DUF433 family)
MAPARPAPTIVGPHIHPPRPHPSGKHTLAGFPPGNLAGSVVAIASATPSDGWTAPLGPSPSPVLQAEAQRARAWVGMDSGAWFAQWGGIPLASMTRLDRITSDPSICHGKPTIRGLRYPVETLLELLASGMTIDEILEDYPALERDDMLAALEFGAKTAGMRRVPLGAA